MTFSLGQRGVVSGATAAVAAAAGVGAPGYHGGTGEICSFVIGASSAFITPAPARILCAKPKIVRTVERARFVPPQSQAAAA